MLDGSEIWMMTAQEGDKQGLSRHGKFGESRDTITRLTKCNQQTIRKLL
jgi:hypothetical protein